ncbi:NeuD/PglB/VioB family sugar acetyltransferase [Roseibium sp. FZY0029]|uniref:NeuD/PglB/VioB family sugar acetyltransferase n=1 Tax=Roseibium sp. FZY0029 TaxID=3116647 RepID=UPI002EA2F015|nr:NeuD/PglB/VioB family sugar acetyltransferase [Roseibium sp. FZY0029]
MKELVIYGAGGNAKVVIDMARLLGWSISGLVDPGMLPGSDILSCKVIAEDEIEARGFHSVFIAIGNNDIRWREYKRLIELGFDSPSLIHPSAIVANSAAIGAGSAIMAGAVIQAAARIGEAVIVNTSASIDHDCELADGAFVGPGALLCGGVKLGKKAFIGAGVIITPNTEVPPRSFVKAGSRLSPGSFT